jgi:hypothetical protein
LEQITTQGSDIKELLIAIEQINIQLAALQTSAKEQQKLSCKENQLIRDKNKQVREELKDLKTQLPEAISQKHNDTTPVSTKSARIPPLALTKSVRIPPLASTTRTWLVP